MRAGENSTIEMYIDDVELRTSSYSVPQTKLFPSHLLDDDADRNVTRHLTCATDLLLPQEENSHLRKSEKRGKPPQFNLSSTIEDVL